MSLFGLLMAGGGKASAQPKFESYAFSDNGGASIKDFPVTLPSGITAGNLLVAEIYTTSGGRTWTVPTGWNRAKALENSALPKDIFWRIADGTEGSTVTITCSGTVTQAAIVMRFSKARMGLTGAVVNKTASSTVATGIVTPVPKCLLLYSVASPQASVGPYFAGPSWSFGDTNASAPSIYNGVEEIASPTTIGNRAAGAGGSTNYDSYFSCILPEDNDPTPAVVGVTDVQNGSNSGSITFTRPTGTVDGHRMLALITGHSSGTWTAPSGWTQIMGDSISGVALFVKTASGESGTYTFTTTYTSRTLGGALLTIDGEYDTVGTVVSGSSTLSPQVTPTADYSRVVSFHNIRGAGATLTVPSGMDSQSYNNDGTDPTWRVSTSSNGAAAGVAFTASSQGSSSTNCFAVALSFKPL